MPNQEILAELKKDVRFRVWSGLFDQKEIVETCLQNLDDGVYSEEMDESINEELVSKLVVSDWTEKLEAEKNWAAETECDKLKNAFEALSRSGILALENAGYTMSDGWSDFQELAHQSPPGSVRGGCFYHGQDLERALEGAGLYLVFGATDGAEAEDKAIAVEVMSMLEKFGLKPTWTKSVKDRIFLPIDWKRRYSPAAAVAT